MSAYEWFTIGQAILMALGMGLLWSLRSAFAGGSLLRRLEDLEKRMDRAGRLSSDLATEVQGLPDLLRSECITRREFSIIQANHEQHFARHAEDHKELWTAVNQLYRRKDQV